MMRTRWLILGLLSLMLSALVACRQYPGDPDYSDAPPRQPTNAAPERGEGR
ncbi:MAG: hypothetical protein NZM28_00955 [Fimbriimonadales bacterium]|nr:hypothetical protein [Fimbriimonadales bacterium]